MLHCAYDSDREEISVAWETPPSEAVRAHPEYAAFFARLSLVPGLRALGDDPHASFAAPYQALIDAFAEVLPRGIVSCQQLIRDSYNFV